jgi:hypothetical protein
MMFCHEENISNIHKDELPYLWQKKIIFVETFIYFGKEGLGKKFKMKVLPKFESWGFHYSRFAKL